MSLRITSSDFDEKVNGSEKIVLVDFYSDSCVPCKMLSPVLSQLEQEYADILDIYKVNAPYEPELAGRFDIQASPTLIFFRNGNEAGRIRGAVKKPDIIAELDRIR